jgi:hypothetical protein
VTVDVSLASTDRASKRDVAIKLRIEYSKLHSGRKLGCRVSEDSVLTTIAKYDLPNLELFEA